MDEWQPDADDDQEGEEGEEGSWSYGGRTASIFLIDAAKEMLQVPTGGDKDDSPFMRAIKAAHATLLRKVISSDQDLLGVVLFNTRETKNPLDYPSVFTLQELERPGAEKILALENLSNMGPKKFEKEYGHSSSGSIHDALRVSQSLFTKCGKRLGGQNILLFTCRDDPHAGDQQKQTQARRKAGDLREAGIALEVLHMGDSFDINKFYKELIIPDEAEDGGEDDSQEQRTLADPTTRLEELMERVRRLDHKQRTTGKITLSLAPGVELSVGVYTSIRKMTKPYKLKLWKNTNEEVKYMKKEFLEETGELLMPSDFQKYQVYGEKRLGFSLDEVRSMGSLYEPGMRLLGFKPISSIKPDHYVKPANFLYPNEASIQGGTKLFAALLDRCLERKVVALVRVVTRKGGSVALAALVPQKEELDEKNCQLVPPGFVVYYLPFLDDVRYLEMENNTRATTDQVDAAKKVVKKLRFKYSPECFDNPDIETHWENIKALALNRAQLEPVKDYTVPDLDHIEKAAGQLLEDFKQQVYPASYDPSAAMPKRAAPRDAPAPKKPKLDPSAVDVEAMAKDGKVDKLTVPVLKAWLEGRGIKVAGKKKAQLVQDVIDAVDA